MYVCYWDDLIELWCVGIGVVLGKNEILGGLFECEEDIVGEF